MAKILVCCLGGTVSSRTENKVIKLSGMPEQKFWDRFKTGHDLKFLTPVLYSSENAGIDTFFSALRGIKKGIEENSPDGVLILHGTDSMAYFAQLAVRVLSYADIPVIITGAKTPPDDPHSDAIKNVKYSFNLLSAAVSSRSGSVTFGIVYSDSFMGDPVFVPAASALDADYYGEYRKHGGKGEITRLSPEEAGALLDRKPPVILTVPDIPGFPYDKIDPASFDAVLIEAYHSGTADSQRLPDLLKRASDASVPCYLGNVPKHSNRYSSELKLAETGITPIEDIPLEGAWAEAVIRTLKD